ncbi:NACHT domain-containing protein [bacterium]|nr:NACHT domain-containing protein [bacterium]
MECDPITLAVFKELASSIAKLVVSKCAQFNFFGSTSTDISDGCNRKLQSHLTEVVSWSQTIHFFGMPNPRDTPNTTVPLIMSTLPRKFSSSQSELATLSEGDLLQTSGHAVLLGDPGAGKTTTMKRLALRLLTSDSDHDSDTWECPICLRLRRINTSIPLHCALADIFGISFGIDPSKSQDALERQSNEIRVAITDILNNGRFVVLLDGLDEVHPQAFNDICAQIVELGYCLTQCKIIVSCRSGAYQKHLDGYSTAELKPLSSDQIRAVTLHWLGTEDLADEFSQQAELSRASDLLDRPLYLAQLLVVFQNSGYLPQQPTYLARRIILLMLEGWDAKRSLHRPSMYANFDAEGKLEFLSCLAFELLLDAKTEFDTFTLQEAYKRIHGKFGLPERETEQVVRELEAHTGLIVESVYDLWSFSHLSIQEYLSANYIVRAPFDTTTRAMSNTYPEVLAVAIALSSDPTEWFIKLVSEPLNYAKSRIIGDGPRFSKRLSQEQPRFSRSSSLGACYMRFALSFDIDATVPLLSIPNVCESVLLVLPYYCSVRVRKNNESIDSERVCVSKDKSYQLPQEFRDDAGIVKPGFLSKLAAEISKHLHI